MCHVLFRISIKGFQETECSILIPERNGVAIDDNITGCCSFFIYLPQLLWLKGRTGQDASGDLIEFVLTGVTPTLEISSITLPEISEQHDVTIFYFTAKIVSGT
ncbi:hypothetical protein GM31_22835 [Trabulsiella odontotermitis]|uniref:Uncharacterized protein n=1 Tax=Trabulsiella odontotermitis TaxID=379893 RepID=A0A0L0GU83_9ENTR|nr:hypothetical protein GM31_22835 [Trabulsiella odontotermitis]